MNVHHAFCVSEWEGSSRSWRRSYAITTCNQTETIPVTRNLLSPPPHVCLIVFTTRFNVVIKSISALLTSNPKIRLSFPYPLLCLWVSVGDDDDNCSLYLPLYLLFPGDIISSPLLYHFAHRLNLRIFCSLDQFDLLFFYTSYLSKRSL